MSAALMDYRDRIFKPTLDTYSGLPSKPQFHSDELPLFDFFFEGQSRPLNRPIALRIGFEGGMYFVDNESLSLFGHGQSIEAAVSEFLHDFAYLWSRYRLLRDDEVEGHGRELKDLLRSLAE